MYTAAAQSYHSVAVKVDKSAWKYMYTHKWLYVYAYYSLIAYLLLNISHDGGLCNSFSSSLFRTLSISFHCNSLSSAFCLLCFLYSLLFAVFPALYCSLPCSLLWSSLQDALVLLYTPVDLICTVYNPSPWFCNVHCDWTNLFTQLAGSSTLFGRSCSFIQRQKLIDVMFGFPFTTVLLRT